MATREEIRRRDDVDEADLDDIVGLAAQLQAEARAEAEQRTDVDAVKAVARELDVEARYVEDAIRKLSSDRAAAKGAEAAAAREAEVRAARRRQRLGFAGVILVGALVLGGSGALVVAEGGRAAIAEAQRVTLQHEADLVVVLDRQRSLVPQVAAMSGAAVEAPALPPDATIADRLRASEALGAAVGRAIAALPPEDSQQRLSLQYEVVGAQNRVDVERTRWEEARAEWAAAASTPSGRLAVALGRAEPPP